MKNIALFSLILLLPHCASTPQGAGFDPTKAAMVVSVTVPSTVRLAATKEPASALYMKNVADAIEIFATGEVLDAEAFKTLLGQNVAVFKTPEAIAAIDTILALYQAYYADAVRQKLDEKQLLPLLQAITASIRKGLK